MLIIIAELFSGVYLRAETHRNQIDSLSNVLLNTIEPSEKLPVLIHLSKLSWQKPKEVSYLKELIDLSLQLDSLNYAYEGYSALCRYYYNDSQLDSLISLSATCSNTTGLFPGQNSIM